VKTHQDDSSQRQLFYSSRGEEDQRGRKEKGKKISVIQDPAKKKLPRRPETSEQVEEKNLFSEGERRRMRKEEGRRGALVVRN